MTFKLRSFKASFGKRINHQSAIIHTSEILSTVNNTEPTMLQKANGTSSSWAGLLIRGPSIPVWFTGDLSAPGGTDACLSEPLQDDGWKNRPHSALPPFSVNLQWKMLNTSDPLSVNELVRCQGGLGTRPLDEECWLMGWWFRVSSKLHNSWTVKQ